MVKKLWLAALLFALVLGFSVTGCGEDDGDGNGGSVDDKKLAGTWNLNLSNIPESESIPKGSKIELKLTRSGTFEAAATVSSSFIIDMISEDMFGEGEPEEGEDGPAMPSVSEIKKIMENILGKKDVTAGIKGSFDSKDGFITVRPNAVKASYLTGAIDEINKQLKDTNSFIYEAVSAYAEEYGITIKDVQNFLAELKKNVSGWIGTKQAQNMLNYVIKNFKTKLDDEVIEELEAISKNIDDYLKQMQGEIPPIPYKIDGKKLIFTMDEGAEGEPAAEIEFTKK